MSNEKYLVCHTCKKLVYVCKNGHIQADFGETDKIAKFIERHEFDCKGKMEVWDECAIPYEYETE